MEVQKFFAKWKKGQPLNKISYLQEGFIVDGETMFEFAEAFHKKKLESAKNPYNKKTNYKEWEGFENTIDNLIRTK